MTAMGGMEKRVRAISPFFFLQSERKEKGDA